MFDKNMLDIVSNEDVKYNQNINYVTGPYGKKALETATPANTGCCLNLGKIEVNSGELTIAGFFKMLPGKRMHAAHSKFWVMDENNNDCKDHFGQSSFILAEHTKYTKWNHHEANLKDDTTIGIPDSILLDIEYEEFFHYAITYTKNEVKVYLNGVLIETRHYQKDINLRTGYLLVGDSFRVYGMQVGGIEAYSRVLNNDEIKVLANQQFFVEKRIDNTDETKAFSFLEEDGKLVEYVVDVDDYIVGKNLVEYEKSEVVPPKLFIKETMLTSGYKDFNLTNANTVTLYQATLTPGSYIVDLEIGSRTWGWDDPDSDNTDPDSGYAYIVVPGVYELPSKTSTSTSDQEMQPNSVYMTETDSEKGGIRNRGYKRIQFYIDSPRTITIAAHTHDDDDGGIHARAIYKLFKQEIVDA